MAITVGQAHDALHHFVAQHDRRRHAPGPRRNLRGTAIAQAEACRIPWIHQQGAAFRPLGEIGQVVEPRVHVAQLTSTDQHQPIGIATFFHAGQQPLDVCFEDLMHKFQTAMIFADHFGQTRF